MKATLSGFAQYLRVERNLSPATIDSYVKDMTAFLRFRFTNLTPDPVASIRQWINSFENPSPSTTTRRLSAIKRYCRYVGVEDHTSLIDRPKRHKGLPKPAKIDRAKLMACPPPLRWTVVFMAETGLRLAEALSVQVEPGETEVRVTGKGSKERWIPLTETAQGAIAVLGGRIPYQRRNLQRLMRLYLDIHPHQLRHRFATDLAENDVDLGDIQDLLGHASPATTRIYTDISKRRLRAAVEKRRTS